MKISVCIPCFKQAEYLPHAIESVLSQTVKPHEIIVVVDGSPDKSLEIAKSYESKGVQVVSQANKGLASARNTGLMNSTGDFFYPLDADDMMLENCIERVSQTIEETDADVIAPSFKCFGLHNDSVVLMQNPTLNDFKPVNGFPMNRIGYFSAIRKSALLEIGGYSPKMTFGWEDYHLWINLLTRGKRIVTIPKILILYRTKESSMIHEANAHAGELMAQIYKDFPQIKCIKDKKCQKK